MAENNSGVSIIVPIYNVESYLQSCLQSIADQDFRNFEVIMVDDGSTDGSSKICKSFLKKYSNFTYIKTENHGLSAARNVGMKKAKYEYIWFIDGDDYVDRKSLSKISRFFGHDIIVIEHFAFYDGSDSILAPAIFHNKNAVRRYLLNLPAAPFKILKRDLLENANFSFPVGRLFEDLASMYSLVRYTADICFTNERLYYYRRRHGSIMHSVDSILNDDRFWAADQVIEHVPERYNQEKEYIITKHIAVYMSQDMARLQYKKYLAYMKKIREYMKKNAPNFRKNKYILQGHGFKHMGEMFYLLCLEKSFFVACRLIALLRGVAR